MGDKNRFFLGFKKLLRDFKKDYKSFCFGSSNGEIILSAWFVMTLKTREDDKKWFSGFSDLAEDILLLVIQKSGLMLQP